MSTTFDCVACRNTFDTDPIPVANDNLCTDCCTTGLVPQFKAALKDETKYPVTWSGNKLEIDSYTRFFNRQFLRDWAAKKGEYETPIAERLYCADATCARYLGLKARHQSTRHCLSCGGRTCADCRGSYLDNQHECKQDEADPLEGQQRGRDYQRCPGCLAPIRLESGCNHLVCRASGACNKLLCGLEASADSGHWNLGMPCPRWGQPGTDNAIYDSAPEDEDEDEDDIDVDDIVVRLLRLGVRNAGIEQYDPPPPSASEERITRHEHRQTLYRISRETLHALGPQAGDAQAMPDWLIGLSLLVSGLITSLTVYTIHFEPDLERRAYDMNVIALLHPFIMDWYDQAGDEGLIRFPEIGPIYERYLWARRLRLQEQADEAAAL